MADKPTYLEYIRQHEEKRRKYAQAHGLDYESLYPTHKKAAPPEAEEERPGVPAARGLNK